MELSAPRLRALLASLKSDQPTDDEARRQPRVGFRGMISVVLLTPGVPPGRPLAVRVVNVSSGGIGFVFPEPLEQNQVVEVRLPRVGGFDSIASVVRHCRRSADGLYSIGVQFGTAAAAKSA